MWKFTFLVFLIFIELTWANDAVYKGNGSDLKPVQESNVQMVSELIYITYGPGMGVDVDVITTFKNHGPAVDLQVGFPIILAGLWDIEDTLHTLPEKYDPGFEIWIDGLKVQTIRQITGEKSEGNFDILYLFNVHFEKNETKIFKHHYNAGGYYSSIGDWSFEYILKTGALWKDKVESIAIVVEIPKYYIPEVQTVWPKEQKVLEDKKSVYLIWKYIDIDPDFNLKLGRLPAMWRLKTAEELLDYLASLQFNSADLMMLNEGERRYLINLIFAIYGYPFKNPFVRNQFYSQRNIFHKIKFKPDEHFNISKIPKEYLEIVEKLKYQNE
jgi:hypothetical protein